MVMALFYKERRALQTQLRTAYPNKRTDESKI
jgi:hypothetical protein